MIKRKKCDNCNRALDDGDKVTLIITNVEVTDRYLKTDERRLKLSIESLENRTCKVYCKKCLDIKGHFLEDKDKK